jgi:hypothetical protein
MKPEIDKLKIILYFLALNGKLTRGKVRVFKTAGRYFYGTRAVYASLIKDCKNTLKNLHENQVEDEDFPELIMHEIENLPYSFDDIDAHDENSYDFACEVKPSASQFKCVWCLMLLSKFYDYDADSIVDFLAGKWNINESYIQKIRGAIGDVEPVNDYEGLEKPDISDYALESPFAAMKDALKKTEEENAEEYEDYGVLSRLLMKILMIIAALTYPFAFFPVVFRFRAVRQKYIKKTLKQLNRNWERRYIVLTAPEKLQMVFMFLLLTQKATKGFYASFDKICCGFSGYNKIRSSIIEECLAVYKRKISKHDDKKRIEELKKEIMSAAKDAFSSYDEHTTRSQLKCFWLLTLAAFYFGNVSDNTMEILSKLSKEWNIKSDVSAELIDTAETFKALEEHKKWLFDLKKTGNYPSGLFNAELNEICKNWKELNQSIFFLVNEQIDDNNNEAEYVDDEDDVSEALGGTDWIESAENEAEEDEENKTVKSKSYDFARFVKK